MLSYGHEKQVVIIGILLLTVVVSMASTAFAFRSIPIDHWSYQATFNLVDDPEVREYINKRINDNKPMLRYNFAVILAKYISPERFEKQIHKLSIRDFDSLKKLIVLFEKELKNLDVETGPIKTLIATNINRLKRDKLVEKKGPALTARPISSLKRIKSKSSTSGKTLDPGKVKNSFHEEITNLKISPGYMKMRAGTKHKFRLFGITMSNSIIPLKGQWELRGQGADLSPEGLLSVIRTGRVKVIAFDQQSGLRASASVAIMADDLFKIDIAPKEISLDAGHGVSFVTTGYDKYGNEVDFTPAWKVLGESGIVSNGHFKALKPGTVTVYASSSDSKIYATAKVRIGLSKKEVAQNISSYIKNIRNASSNGSDSLKARGLSLPTKIAGLKSIAGQKSDSKKIKSPFVIPYNEPYTDQAAVESERILIAKEELLKERLKRLRSVKKMESEVADLKAAMDPGKSLSTRLRSDHANIMSRIKPLSAEKKLEKSVLPLNKVGNQPKSGIRKIANSLSENLVPLSKIKPLPKRVVKVEIPSDSKKIIKDITVAPVNPIRGLALNPTQENKRKKKLMLNKIKKEINAILREKKGLTGLSSFEKIFSDPGFRDTWDKDVLEKITENGINAVKLAEYKAEQREIRFYILRNAQAQDVKSAIASSVFGSKENCRYHVDTRTNTIVISAPIDTLTLFSKYIRMIDVPRATTQKNNKTQKHNNKEISLNGRRKQ